jgi:hypothetical protein
MSCFSKGRQDMLFCEPQVGDIWYFHNIKKHVLFLDKEECDEDYRSYKWDYEILYLETGKRDTVMYGHMDAYGDGWFVKLV